MPSWFYSLYAALRRWLLCVSLLGTRHQCPFCEWRFRRFLPTGSREPVWREKSIVAGGYRLHGLCPRCYSIDKERLLYLYLRRHTNLFSPDRASIRLLHVAPEGHLGQILRALPNVEYVSGDLTPGRAMVVMDITRIGYPDHSFDVILCSHVLEHVVDDRTAMRELYRVLAPGGWAVLQVPISSLLGATFEDPRVKDPKERERIFGQNDHVRIYGRDYVARLEEAGFRVERWSALKEWGSEEVARYCITPEELVFVGRK